MCRQCLEPGKNGEHSLPAAFLFRLPLEGRRWAAADRPARHELPGTGLVPNNFGTNEFVTLC